MSEEAKDGHKIKGIMFYGSEKVHSGHIGYALLYAVTATENLI